MKELPKSLDQSSDDDPDEPILNKIRPMVLLLLGLLLGIAGNMFVNALFLDVDFLPSNYRFTMIGLGLTFGLYCILLLYLEIHPDLKKLKNYPKKASSASNYLLIIFIIVWVCIGAWGIFGSFPPQNSSKICQNITYVVNNYYQNYTIQNYTLKEINVGNKDTIFSINELKYLLK